MLKTKSKMGEISLLKEKKTNKANLNVYKKGMDIADW